MEGEGWKVVDGPSVGHCFLDLITQSRKLVLTAPWSPGEPSRLLMYLPPNFETGGRVGRPFCSVRESPDDPPRIYCRTHVSDPMYVHAY